MKIGEKKKLSLRNDNIYMNFLIMFYIFMLLYLLLEKL